MYVHMLAGSRGWQSRRWSTGLSVRTSSLCSMNADHRLECAPRSRKRRVCIRGTLGSRTAYINTRDDAPPPKPSGAPSVAGTCLGSQAVSRVLLAHTVVSHNPQNSDGLGDSGTRGGPGGAKLPWPVGPGMSAGHLPADHRRRRSQVTCAWIDTYVRATHLPRSRVCWPVSGPSTHGLCVRWTLPWSPTSDVRIKYLRARTRSALPASGLLMTDRCLCSSRFQLPGGLFLLHAISRCAGSVVGIRRRRLLTSGHTEAA